MLILEFDIFHPIKSGAEAIGQVFIGILLTLDAMIYSLISWVYQIILALCNVDILKNSLEIENLVNRIYIILGVIILFLVAYSLLKSMINPDEALKGKKSPVTIIKDVIISVVAIALIPTIFSFAMDFQSSLLTRNTIGTLVLGANSTAGGNSEEMINIGGMNISSGVLNAFLHPNYNGKGCTTITENGITKYDCSGIHIDTKSLNLNGDDSFDNFWLTMQTDGDLMAITDLNDNIASKEITYNFIISTVAGIVVLIVLLLYCFDIAIRQVKLAVFELIAPLPILARILPNEQGGKVFSNWLKAVISTYAEVFIRLAILFFGVLIIKIIMEAFPQLIQPLFAGNTGIQVALFAQAFLIMGVILFIRQAPDIIKDITGLDASKYNPLKSAMQMGSMIGGVATAAVRNFNDKTDPKHPDRDRSMFNRFRSALGGAGSAFGRSFIGMGNVKDPKSMKENASKSAANAVKAHNDRISRQARYARTGENRFTDLRTDIKDWASGSFEAQQKMLDEINAFMNDAKAVKSTTEGFIRDKKYLFKYGKDSQDGEFGWKEIEEETTDANGNIIKQKKLVPRVKIDRDTTFDQIDAMVQSLKSSGDVEDAKAAAALESAMNKQIKTIGQRLVEASIDSSKVQSFQSSYMAPGKTLEADAKTTTAKAKAAYEIVKDKMAENSALSAVKEFRTQKGDLKFDNVSDLADQLEIQSDELQRKIKLEQDKRKAKEKK